jgi:hypothetical protein
MLQELGSTRCKVLLLYSLPKKPTKNVTTRKSPFD